MMKREPACQHLNGTLIVGGDPHRLELEDTQHGNVEFRQEQARLQEEWSTTEKVLRKTQMRFVHEIDQRRELKNCECKNSPHTIERRS